MSDSSDETRWNENFAGMADLRDSGEPLAVAKAWPPSLDLRALATREPKPPQFIIADWLPAGYATLFAGHGGAGKSSIALHLAVCIALGQSFFGLQVEQRRVAYLSCEDREGVLHWRLARICDYLGCSMAELYGSLDMRDLVGHDSMLWVRDPRTGYTFTTAFDALSTQIEQDHTQVVFVDGISDTFGGGENVRAEVKAYVNRLLALIPTDGALILLGHVAKMTANGTDAEGYSGSTQWHNAVRARWYLFPETEPDEDGARRRRTGKLTLELQKSNHGRTEQTLTFEWDSEAHLFAATGTMGASRIDRKHRDDVEQRAIVAALFGCEKAGIVVPSAAQGRRTALNVLSLRPEFPPALKTPPARRFWVQIEALRQIRLIDEIEYRRANRHHATQFVLTPEGRAQCVE